MIAAYEQQGRFDEAIAIVWADFSQRPALHLYQKLKQQADKADAWQLWRNRALDHARQMAARSNPPASAYRFASLGHSLLVEISL